LNLYYSRKTKREFQIDYDLDALLQSKEGQYFQRNPYGDLRFPLMIVEDHDIRSCFLMRDGESKLIASVTKSDVKWHWELMQLPKDEKEWKKMFLKIIQKIQAFFNALHKCNTCGILHDFGKNQKCTQCRTSRKFYLKTTDPCRICKQNNKIKFLCDCPDSAICFDCFDHEEKKYNRLCTQCNGKNTAFIADEDGIRAHECFDSDSDDSDSDESADSQQHVSPIQTVTQDVHNTKVESQTTESDVVPAVVPADQNIPPLESVSSRKRRAREIVKIE